jgi:protease I
VGLVQEFAAAGKPIGVICHGPWTLVEADLVRGRRITSWPSLETDIRNAGGEWVDEEVVVDAGLVSSRNPDDLPAFCEAIVAEFSSNEGTPSVAAPSADRSTPVAAGANAA